MVKFHEVDPKEFDGVTSTRGRKGVYMPILQQFLDTGLVLGKIDRQSTKRTAASLYQGLRHHILQNELPLKIFTRNNELYLMRLDLNEDGTPNPDYQGPSPSEAMKSKDEVRIIDAEEIRKRANSSAGKDSTR